MNMKIYEASRAVPEEAQKKFNNGRFSGTDINPMWRIKKLTELFGPAGSGWWTEDVKYWMEAGVDGVVAAFCSLNLRYEQDGKVSHPVHGIGGNAFIQKEKSGLRTSDEAFKMAYTDALSIAAKALGIGADIWFGNDRSKYESGSNFDDMETLDDFTDVYLAMREADDLDTLKEIFGAAWSKARETDKKSLKEAYDKRKGEINK